MKYNFWFVIFLALMPVFVMFVGLSAAGGFESSADLEIIGIVVSAGLAAGYLAKRRFDESVESVPDEATSTDDVSTPASERDNASVRGYSSPPCFLHELDPSYLGYSTREEVLALLNQLLESEQAGARGADAMSERAASVQTRNALREIAEDSARFCMMLSGHIARLGDTPSTPTGVFHNELAAGETFDDPPGASDRSLVWVVRTVRAAIPRIADDPLRADLQGMLETHQRNLERCAQLGRRPEALAAV